MMEIAIIEFVTGHALGIKLLSIQYGDMNKALLGFELYKRKISLQILFFTINIY